MTAQIRAHSYAVEIEDEVGVIEVGYDDVPDMIATLSAAWVAHRDES